METTFAVYIYTICMTVIFILAFLCWIKRKEVNDRARTILAIINFFFGPMLAVYITFLSAGKVSTVHAMFTPALCIGGFYAFVSIMYYPIEVIRPNWPDQDIPGFVYRNRLTYVPVHPIQLA